MRVLLAFDKFKDALGAPEACAAAARAARGGRTRIVWLRLTATAFRDVNMNVFVRAWHTASGTHAISCARVNAGCCTRPVYHESQPSAPPTAMYRHETVTGSANARSSCLL